MITFPLKSETGKRRIGWKPRLRTVVAWASCPCPAPAPVTPGNRSRSHSGAALIIVLASLIFVSVLTVAFLMSMRSKLVLSKSGSDAGEVKMLSETAVNIAISQVRDATKKSGSSNLAWASQPGMVRLYDDSGNPAGYYKLYSAEDMVATSGGFDPSAEAVPSGWAGDPSVFTDLNAPANGIFPIIDSAAASAMGVQGFSLTTPPTIGTTNPAPMPVKWLYVLEDGTLHPPGPGSAGTKALIPAATNDNPIVGRVAFWADDETCKVNVNTASEGTFWATPRFNTTGDRNLAIFQPARGEFQSYPGHPATVSLKSLFPSLTAQQIFSLAPRLTFGGSEGATKQVLDVSTWIETDHDRLYASVDELLLDDNRAVNAGLSRSNVEAGRFFLTASSRAPELNLFGLPRIATWPLHEVNDEKHRTANDRLLAFCATLGGPPPAQTFPFYFTRQESVLPEHDISLARNRTLLNYLDRVTAKPIPGFGGSFQNGSKYGSSETRQILTEIFDYIRCTNLCDFTTPQSPADSGRWPYAFGMSTRGPQGEVDHGRGSSLGTAVPAYHAAWGTRGFGGRWLQPRAAHVHFVGLGNASSPILAEQTGTRHSSIVANVPPANTIGVQAYVYLSMLTPGEGIQHWSPGHWIEIEGLNQFGIKLKPTDAEFEGLGFPAKGEMNIMGRLIGSGRISSIEPFGFTNAQTTLKKLSASPSGDFREHFPFFSFILPVDSTSPTMAFKGGTITVRIYADPPWSSPAWPTAHGALIQTFTLTFPDTTLPTPLLATTRLVGSGELNNPIERWRPYWEPLPQMEYFEESADVLRTVPLDEGDIRLLAGPETTPFFKVKDQAGYDNSSVRMAPAPTVLANALSRNGELVAGASYSPDGSPFIPDHIKGAVSNSGALGDWDNGTAQTPDGPFINAADPGSLALAATGDKNIGYFFNSYSTVSARPQFFSPNRQMPGPVMFGSLSTGVQRRLPWQTLLFRPGPPNHPGAASPPDHLLLDLFWMPIVEPYAISEPFSTAGKINMNQQLVPFTYINRMAGLRAALAAEQIAVVGKGVADKYKKDNPYAAGVTLASRSALNLSETDGTLRQFKEKFDKGEIFRSATEICDIFLVPEGKAWSTDAAARSAWYGDDFAMVGDNTRERPYAHLHNKLTTKSNTFTVHYHAEVLQKPKSRMASAPTEFDTAKGDRTAAAERGATTFERYLDPSDPRIVSTDPAAASATSLEEFYRTRIVHTSVFRP